MKSASGRLYKNAIFGCITRKKHRGQTAVYLSYIRVALGVSDEVRRQIARFYQMTMRLEGAIYILSVFFTLKVEYHSGKFLGGMLARRM